MKNFTFGTKAQNLLQLEGLTSAQVLKQKTFTVKEWTRDPQLVIQDLKDAFTEDCLVVRSNSPMEDTNISSMAGAFTSLLNVSWDELEYAIGQVIGSYKAYSQDISDWTVLVQPMLKEEVNLSGVMFTRDFNGSPYYVINYSLSGNTDDVTSGATGKQKVVKVFKYIKMDLLDNPIRSIVEMAKELESKIGVDHLDIEFAQTKLGLYLLQVRPLVISDPTRLDEIDRFVQDEIKSMKEFITESRKVKSQVFGDDTGWSDMTDWNPSEIIGSRPKPLAYSLYSYLILKSTWRKARARIGYSHPFHQHLMINLGGHPYIDLRTDFNTYIPDQLRNEIKTKLVNYYLKRVREKPELHDKVEFAIVRSSMNFDFEEDESFKAHFSNDERKEIREALLQLTNNLVKNDQLFEEMEQRLAKMEERRKQLVQPNLTPSSILQTVEQLLQDTISYGTYTFSVVVRGTFIAHDLLKSLKRKGILSQTQVDRFLKSIQTVTTNFVQDQVALAKGKLTKGEFLKRYGHLRPGTYDILTPSYSESPDLYISGNLDTAHLPEEVEFDFDFETKERMKKAIQSAGFTFDTDKMLEFIRKRIEGRERFKFEFSKNISVVLTLLSQFGEFFHIDDLSYLNIEDLLKFSHQNLSPFDVEKLKETIKNNKKRFEMKSYLSLPDVIFDEHDVEVVYLPERKPNFVTQEKITAELVILDEGGMPKELDLEGKIVIVKQADPGYDWLFGWRIAGLVTQYGGAASHMAIRCNEMHVPAAIGCGTKIYEYLTSNLLQGQKVELDCAKQTIKKLGEKLP